jgi:ActR/RegA family two-component response regulator
MELRCLLLTRDDQIIRVLRRVLEDLEVAVDVCTGADKAAELLEQRKFDAVMIDCDDVHNALTVLCSVRLTPSNKSSTVFAIVNGITTVSNAIELGANLALEKPLSETKAKHAFKAVHGLMLQERRRYYRHPIDMAVTLRFEDKDKGDHREVLATGTNLSEGGMALKVKATLPREFRTAQLRFIMPGTHDQVQLLGVISWADEQGNAGVRFENVPYTLRERLDKFFRDIEAQDKVVPPPKKQRTN